MKRVVFFRTITIVPYSQPRQGNVDVVSDARRLKCRAAPSFPGTGTLSIAAAANEDRGDRGDREDWGESGA